MRKPIALLGAAVAIALAVPVSSARAGTQLEPSTKAPKEVCKTSKTVTARGATTRSSRNTKTSAKVKFCAQVVNSNTIRLRGELSFSTSGVSKKDRIRDVFKGAPSYKVIVRNSGIRHSKDQTRPVDSCSPSTGGGAFFMEFQDFWSREAGKLGNTKATYPMDITCNLGFGDPTPETDTTAALSKGTYEAWFALAWSDPQKWDMVNEQTLKVRISIK